MTESKSGSNLRQINQWQKNAARAEYLRHPDASISDVARACNISVRTAARARAVLVREGLLAPGRKAESGADAAAMAILAKEAASHKPKPVEDAPAETEVEPAPPAKPRGSKQAQGETIDGEALRQMSAMLDELADEDDETTRKRMLRQVKRFAFDPNLHPDTRMSASQLWAKLLDMARAKDLGPGKPTTLTAAIDRATDFLRACGPKVAVPAFYKAFDIGDPNGQPTTQAVESSTTSSAPVQVAGAPNDDAHTTGET